MPFLHLQRNTKSAVQTMDKIQSRFQFASVALVTWAVFAVILLFVGSTLAQDPGTQPGAAAAAPAPVQELETLPILPKFVIPEADGTENRDQAREIRQRASEVRKLLNTTEKTLVNGLRSGDVGSIQTELNEYLNGYLFPKMAQKDDLALSELGDLRRDFFRNFLSDKIAANGRAVVIQNYAIPFAQRVVNGNFHKAAKLNAVVLLGMLNDAEGDSRTLPRPSNAALPILVQLFNDPAQPEWIKVAALAGIQRHVDTDRHASPQRIDQPTRTSIANQCMAIINDAAEGQDKWAPELAYWMKRRSTQTLGSMGTPGPDNEYIKTLQAVLDNEDNSIWLRLDALLGMSKIPVDGLDTALASELTNSVTMFTTHALDFEAVRLEKQLRELIELNLLLEDKDLLKTGTAKRDDDRNKASMGMGFGEPGEGGGSSDSESDVPQLELPTFMLNDSRRRVKAYLYGAKNLFENSRTGKKGLISVVAEKDRTKLQLVLELLDHLMKDSDTGIVDLSKADDTEEADDAKKIPVTVQLARIYKKGAIELERLAAPKPNAADAFAAPPGDSDSEAGSELSAPDGSGN